MRCNFNILISGEGRAGKDSLALAIEREYDLKFRSSSQVASEEVIYPLMPNFYESPSDAFNRRHENRELWAACIRDYNRYDKAKLAKMVCADGYGYVGLRDIDEVEECVRQGLFTHIIYVERPDLPQNDPTMTYGYLDLMRLQHEYKNFKLTHVGNMYKGHLDEVVKTKAFKEFLFDD